MTESLHICKLFAERHECLAVAFNGVAEDVGQLVHIVQSLLIIILANQRRNTIQSVEKEMGVDMVHQSRVAALQALNLKLLDKLLLFTLRGVEQIDITEHRREQTSDDKLKNYDADKVVIIKMGEHRNGKIQAQCSQCNTHIHRHTLEEVERMQQTYIEYNEQIEHSPYI